MTALVGVLNKHAVAIAADSAVTMGNTHKVVNSANKIFTLSKFHPVAVMVYNNAAFMGVPWDIIIKEYRKELGNKALPSVKCYVDDFVRFLHSRDFFCDSTTQSKYLGLLLEAFWDLCISETHGGSDAIATSGYSEDKVKYWLNQALTYFEKHEKCPKLKDYSYDAFIKTNKEVVGDCASNKGLSDKELLSKAFHAYLCTQISTQLSTGLVFVGYGEDEIYPSLYPLDVAIGVDKRLRYYCEEKKVAVISENGSHAIITPFAQTDVTQTIIQGINPSFQDIIYSVTEKSIKEFINVITSYIDADPTAAHVSKSIRNLETDDIIRDIMRQMGRQMFESYTKLLLNTVISLDKEDMANMAESFIALTSLVRRMQPGEETVGGPVDVAVISKGDGFVWIKRKHYFKPELNAAFFNNYFK